MLLPSYFEAVPPLCGKRKGYPVQCRHTSIIFDIFGPLSVEDSEAVAHIQCHCLLPARVMSTVKIWGRCKITLLTFQPDQKLYEHG